MSCIYPVHATNSARSNFFLWQKCIRGSGTFTFIYEFEPEVWPQKIAHSKKWKECWELPKQGQIRISKNNRVTTLHSCEGDSSISLENPAQYHIILASPHPAATKCSTIKWGGVDSFENTAGDIWSCSKIYLACWNLKPACRLQNDTECWQMEERERLNVF